MVLSFRFWALFDYWIFPDLARLIPMHPLPPICQSINDCHTINTETHTNTNKNMTFELLKVCRQANPAWIELRVMYVKSTVNRLGYWGFIIRLILLRFSFVFYINLPIRKSNRMVLSFRFWALFDYWIFPDLTRLIPPFFSICPLQKLDNS
jgi:hypothetical protein